MRVRRGKGEGSYVGGVEVGSIGRGHKRGEGEEMNVGGGQRKRKELIYGERKEGEGKD